MRPSRVVEALARDLQQMRGDDPAPAAARQALLDQGLHPGNQLAQRLAPYGMRCRNGDTRAIAA